MKLAVLLIAVAAVAAPLAFAQAGSGGGEPLFDSGPIETAATFSWTFNETGTFAYHCKFHASMHGTVNVVEGGPASGAAAIVTNKYAPPSITIGKGATMSWTNADATAHTVTADATKGGNATRGKGHTMPNATIDRVPPEAASKGLARAEDARLFGKLTYANGSATGRFVSFNYSESDGVVSDFMVAGWNGSAFDSVTPDPWTANGTPKAHGALFRADADEATLGIHNNPTASLHFTASNATNVTFALGEGVTIDSNNSTASAWRLNAGGRHGHLALLGNATATTDNASITVTLAAGDGVLFLAHPDKDQAAASSIHGIVAQAKRVGSILDVADADGTPVEDELSLSAHAQTRSLAKGRAVVTVTSDTSEGKLIVIRFANGTFSHGRLNVTIANETVNATDGGSDASGPIASVVAGGKAAAVVTFTANVTEVAVFVPHFSEQTVTIQESAGDGTTPTTPTGSTSPTGTSTPPAKGVPGFGAALLLAAAIGALALARRR